LAQHYRLLQHLDEFTSRFVTFFGLLISGADACPCRKIFLADLLVCLLACWLATTSWAQSHCIAQELRVVVPAA